MTVGTVRGGSPTNMGMRHSAGSHTAGRFGSHLGTSDGIKKD